jgi:hypothetical protein
MVPLLRLPKFCNLRHKAMNTSSQRKLTRQSSRARSLSLCRVLLRPIFKTVSISPEDRHASTKRPTLSLPEGHRLLRPTTAEYVGTSGNATPDTPHRHFAIFKLGAERRWWKGIPINPIRFSSRTGNRPLTSSVVRSTSNIVPQVAATRVIV